MEILLTTGPSIPNVNLTNGDKETALHCAAQYGHTEVVQLLLGAGAEPNIKNSKEETALDLAAQVINTRDCTCNDTGREDLRLWCIFTLHASVHSRSFLAFNFPLYKEKYQRNP